MNESGPSVTVSCIVPARNEEASLAEVHRRFAAAMHRRGWSHELILVDDGSTDASWSLIDDLALADENVRGIRLAHGAGMLEAVAVGMAEARGSVVCMLEADLESRPEDLPSLIDQVLAGYELVAGVRTNQRSRPGLRWLGSAVLRAVMAHTVHQPDDLGCGVKAMSRGLARRVIEDPASGTDLRFGFALLERAHSFEQRPIPWVERGHRSHFSTLGLARNLATFTALVFRRRVALAARFAPPIAFVVTASRCRLPGQWARPKILVLCGAMWAVVAGLLWMHVVAQPDGLPGSTARVAERVGGRTETLGA